MCNQEFRFLLSQLCNYNCSFCHNEGLEKCKLTRCLDVEDYLFLYRTGYLHKGFSTVTLSGGEPLLNKSVIEIASKLCKAGAVITLTTNAYNLDRQIEIGKYISYINVSLHSMRENRYEKIVNRKGTFKHVINNICNFARTFCNVPICLNITLVNKYNNDERSIKEILEFAKKIKAKVKFIELFPEKIRGYVPLECVSTILMKNKYIYINESPRKRYYSDGITDVYLTQIICASNKYNDNAYFCHFNNDIYVTPSGEFEICRLNKNRVDAWDAIKGKNMYRMATLIDETLNMLGNYCILKDQEKVQSVYS